MPSYVVQIVYDVEADSPEIAAMALADMIDEGLFYRPVCDVYSESGALIARVDTENETIQTAN